MKKQRARFLKFFFLWPLARLWELIYMARRTCYDMGLMKQERFAVPIISIGNLSFGGTGKTPFTLWLASYLEEKEKNVAILMRGYKGQLEKSSGMITQEKKDELEPLIFGDEPILLARRLKRSTVLVGKKRSRNLRYYYEQLNADVVLLDDGHQHLQLARQLNIVLFDATMGLDLYELAPVGYLREGLTSLKDADVVVIGRVNQVHAEKKAELVKIISPYLASHVKWAEVSFIPGGFFNIYNQKKFELHEIKDKKVILIAGIANPKAFFKTVESMGAKIVFSEAFPDHHYFKDNEIASFVQLAEKEEAIIITTEKDMVRLQKRMNDRLLFSMRIDLHFESGEDELRKLIDQTIQG